MLSVRCSDGILLCGGDANIKFCRVERCSGSGLVFNGSTGRCSVSNAVVENCLTGVSCLEGSIVCLTNAEIKGCGGSGIVSSHHCNIIIESVTVDTTQEHIIALAEFCSIKISKCTLRRSCGSAVVVSRQSSCTVNDTVITDCGGAGLECAGKLAMVSSSCSRNSCGVVLLQMTEANLTSCVLSENSLAGVWSIGDACHVTECSFVDNRGCAYTVGKGTAFSEDKCRLQSNGSTSTFLIWKTARRSATVEVNATRLPALRATSFFPNFYFLQVTN